MAERAARVSFPERLIESAGQAVSELGEAFGASRTVHETPGVDVRLKNSPGVLPFGDIFEEED